MRETALEFHVLIHSTVTNLVPSLILQSQACMVMIGRNCGECGDDDETRAEAVGFLSAEVEPQSAFRSCSARF